MRPLLIICSCPPSSFRPRPRSRPRQWTDPTHRPPSYLSSSPRQTDSIVRCHRFCSHSPDSSFFHSDYWTRNHLRFRLPLLHRSWNALFVRIIFFTIIYNNHCFVEFPRTYRDGMKFNYLFSTLIEIKSRKQIFLSVP